MKTQKLFKAIMLILIACLYTVSVVKVCFFSVDNAIGDSLYRQFGTPDRNIVIVSIEDSTLEKYGSFSSFSREKTAELINYLNRDEANKPAVIGIDIMFSGTSAPETDAKLVEVAKASDNVVFASSIMYRSTMKIAEDGSRYIDSRDIVTINRSFDAMNEAAEFGFTNANISDDGIIRSVRIYDTYQGERLNSFDEAVIMKYTNSDKPISDESNVGFYYVGTPGEYQHFALERVLEGSIPPSVFAGSIVLVGAYASGLGDSYVTAADRGIEMYGVEIHANIIQSLLESRTFNYANYYIYALVSVAIWIVLFIICSRLHLAPALLIMLAAQSVHIGVGVALSRQGIVIPQFYFILLTVFSVIYFVVDKYVLERIKKKKVLASFKKYVAPQVVDGLSKDENYEIRLGGRKRDIAVLFVDIRGFTPLSESLTPEQVVGVLDEYLALTTKCIFKNNGTLDKFIGDATMAIFNAPFDLEDYEMWAIKTALDIRDGGEEMAEVLYEKFGRKVHFGIGVNCGDAVVGNIGCDIRMDYTAIGDTVNTAARLEGKAAPSEILISPMLYERVKDRIVAEQVGEMALKGKAEAMLVYRVIGLK